MHIPCTDKRSYVPTETNQNKIRPSVLGRPKRTLKSLHPIRLKNL